MTDLFFEKKGQGNPIVLIHGGGTDSRDWQLLTPYLTQHFSVITYDLRGSGNSPIPTEKTDHLSDLSNLLNYLNIGNAALVGHSLGGQIAVEFALSNPERVNELILLAPGLTGFEFNPTYQNFTNKMWQAVPNDSKMLQLMFNSPENYAVQNSLKTSSKELILKIHHENIRKSLTWKNFEQKWPDPPSIEHLEDLDANTLLILGNEDKKDLFKIKDMYENNVRNIKIEMIENADHLMVWSHPELISELIVSFIAKAA